jgi:hypothetical protein
MSGDMTEGGELPTDFTDEDLERMLRGGGLGKFQVQRNRPAIITKGI